MSYFSYPSLPQPSTGEEEMVAMDTDNQTNGIHHSTCERCGHVQPLKQGDAYAASSVAPTRAKKLAKNDDEEVSIHTLRAAFALPWVMFGLHIVFWIVLLTAGTQGGYDSGSILPFLMSMPFFSVWNIWQIVAGHTRGTNLKVATWASIAHLIFLFISIIFGMIFRAMAAGGVAIAIFLFQIAWTCVAFRVISSNPCCCCCGNSVQSDDLA